MNFQKTSSFSNHEKLIDAGNIKLQTTISKHHPHRQSYIKDANSEIVVVTYARIYNIHQLSNQLNVSTLGNSKILPAKLILRAYQKWGEQCVKYLEGDWVFVLYDKKQEVLLVARDAFGTGTIYFYESNEFFAFSTDIKELLSTPRLPKEINTNTLLQLRPDYKRDSSTFYKNIYFIPSGHYIKITPLLKKELKNYWIPFPTKTIYYKNDNDYVEHFLELYTEAVKCRIEHNKMGISLSSGLDSGSTAALASPFFEKEGRKLEAFTWFNNNIGNFVIPKGRYTNEVPLVRELLKMHKGIRLHPVEPHKKNIISHILKVLDIYQQPILNSIHIHEVYGMAQSQGVKTILSGDFANFSVSYRGDRAELLNTLFSQFKWNSYLKEIVEWKKVSGNSLMRHIGLLVKNTFLNSYYHSNKKVDYHPFKQVVNDSAFQDHRANYQGLTPWLEEQRMESKGAIRFLMHFHQQSLQSLVSEAARGYGMELSIPAFDKRLIEFLINVPNEQFVGEGHEKWLIKRAMKNKMPDAILFNRKRGLQASDWWVKFRIEINEIIDYIEAFKASPLASYWLNIKELEKIVRTIKDDKPKKFFTMNFIGLMHGLTVGIFLMRMENGYYNG